MKQSEFSFNCERVDSLIAQDQLYRKNGEIMLSPYFYYFDSLTSISNHTAQQTHDSDSLSNESIKAKVEALTEVYLEKNKSIIDSLWNIQDDIDRKNTALMLSVVKSSTYDAMKNVPYKCGREALFVFLHSPEDLFENIKSALDHIDLKKIDPAQYGHIMWHLEGRE
jgi:hypothetical protein